MWIWGAQWIRSFLRVGAGRAARLLGEVVKLDRAGAGEGGEVG